MDEKRMVGDYTVINSMYIGHREIILGENQKAASGERYVCCYAERVMFYEQYRTMFTGSLAVFLNTAVQDKIGVFQRLVV